MGPIDGRFTHRLDAANRNQSRSQLAHTRQDNWTVGTAGVIALSHQLYTVGIPAVLITARHYDISFVTDLSHLMAARIAGISQC